MKLGTTTKLAERVDECCHTWAMKRREGGLHEEGVTESS